MTPVIAVCQEKGGVGKTTTTLCLARAASTEGLRALVVDLDPQGDLSDAFGIASDAAGMADVLDGQRPLAEVLVPSGWAGVDVAPAGERLDSVEVDMLSLGGERRVADALATLTDPYDVVLLDTRPSTGRLTLGGLVAATTALIVTNPHRLAAKALGPAQETLDLVRSHANPGLRLGGVLVNHLARKDTLVSRNYRIEIGGMGLPILEPDIPFTTAVATVSATGVGLDEVGREDLHRLYVKHLHALMSQEVAA